MKYYSFEELKEGVSESFNVTVTEEMLEAFRRMSGDENPLHCDAEYAKESGFPDRVVYGMLTASFYSTLAGVYLPGERCLLQEVNSRFRAPVFVGDTLTVEGTVKERHEGFQRIRITATIRNQEGKKVSTAEIWASIRPKEGPA
ncbi:MAG: MaoC family dehydratase [Lachnospiraceae bacterium]|nr:MaoC family dehydratase [Lachnospiraceae bacterium]